MRLALGSDHAGFGLKQALAADLREMGHDVVDLGAHDELPSDYPDFAEAVGNAVVNGEADRGLVICGSGVGAAMAANKVPGVRAGNVSDTYSAHQGVEHDDMNVLVLGSRVLGIEVARELVKSFLNAQFSGEERHVRRLNKLAQIEARHSGVLK